MDVTTDSWRDLTLAKREVLRTVARSEPVTNTELATALGVGQQVTHRHRTDLADAGLLDVSDADGRTLSIRVSERGRELLAEADA